MPLDAKTLAHFETLRTFREDLGVVPRDTGEPVSFVDSKDRAAMGRKWGLDHPDWETRRRNIRRFQQSEDFRLRSPYRRRHY